MVVQRAVPRRRRNGDGAGSSGGLWRWAAAAMALALLAHGLSLKNPFVYDDEVAILHNPSLAQPLNWVFVLVHDRFRPLTNVSYALDVLLFGMRPSGFHLTSL